jgi:hypothetical protein
MDSMAHLSFANAAATSDFAAIGAAADLIRTALVADGVDEVA